MVEVTVVRVVVVVLDARQIPGVPGLSCLQVFTNDRHAFRCAAFICRQVLFSAFVPVQVLFLGTSARQLLTSCRQSLRQWPGFAATGPAKRTARPTVASTMAAKGLSANILVTLCRWSCGASDTETAVESTILTGGTRTSGR